MSGPRHLYGQMSPSYTDSAWLGAWEELDHSRMECSSVVEHVIAGTLPSEHHKEEDKQKKPTVGGSLWNQTCLAQNVLYSPPMGTDKQIHLVRNLGGPGSLLGPSDESE